MGKGCEMGLDMAASSTLVIPSPLNLLYFQPPKDQAGANHLCIISATPGFSSFLECMALKNNVSYGT